MGLHYNRGQVGGVAVVLQLLAEAHTPEYLELACRLMLMVIKQSPRLMNDFVRIHGGLVAIHPGNWGSAAVSSPA
jgi:hypothetical protein